MYDVVTKADGPVSTAVGTAEGFRVTVDRPVEAGGGGEGFNGAQLLHLAVAGCISNDLYREAGLRGIELASVEVRCGGDFAGQPARSMGISYEVDLAGKADEQQLRDLVTLVDQIAEVPNSLRGRTSVTLGAVQVTTV